ncbi:MAG: hypothetical protein WCD37_03130 [Chloroflexia bacterium]
MGEVVVSGTVGAEGAASWRPYAPSFVDRLTDWVRRLPIPAWLFYLLFALFFVLLFTSMEWLSGSMPMGTFDWSLILGAITFPYALTLLHYLDDSAQASLDDFRPIMQIDDAEFSKLRYQFTTLPARPTLVVAGLGALYGVSSLLYIPSDETEPFVFVVFFIIFAVSYTAAPLLIYHSIRQLRMISRAYTSYARVDLFNLPPMHALSRLTARTAIGIALLTNAWSITNLLTASGEALSSSMIEFTIFSALIAIVFVVPLIGARRLLREAKARAKAEASQHLKATVAELYRRREAGDFGEMAGIKEAMEALQSHQARLDKISSWPWQAETLRGVATAILLPVVVWAITRILEQFWAF